MCARHLSKCSSYINGQWLHDVRTIMSPLSGWENWGPVVTCPRPHRARICPHGLHSTHCVTASHVSVWLIDGPECIWLASNLLLLLYCYEFPQTCVISACRWIYLLDKCIRVDFVDRRAYACIFLSLPWLLASPISEQNSSQAIN